MHIENEEIVFDIDDKPFGEPLNPAILLYTNQEIDEEEFIKKCEQYRKYVNYQTLQLQLQDIKRAKKAEEEKKKKEIRKYIISLKDVLATEIYKKLTKLLGI